MKIAVQKNNLVGQIWYRSLDPVKKRHNFGTFNYVFFNHIVKYQP